MLELLASVSCVVVSVAQISATLCTVTHRAQDVVVSGLSNVADPWQPEIRVSGRALYRLPSNSRSVSRLLNNLEIPNYAVLAPAFFAAFLHKRTLDSRHCKVWDLKLDRDWCLLVNLLAADGRQAKVGAHEVVLGTTELLNLPDERRLFRGVDDRAD